MSAGVGTERIMASQLSVVASIGLVVLVVALVLAQNVWATTDTSTDLQALTKRTTEGVRRYLKRHESIVLSLTALGTALLFVLYGVAYQFELVPSVSAREAGLWTVASVTAGALTTMLATRVSATLVLKLVSPVAEGARRSFDLALRSAIRGGFGCSALGTAVALIGYTMVFAAAHAYASPKTDRELLMMVWLTVGYPLGAAFVALQGQVGGGLLSIAAKTARPTRELDDEPASSEPAAALEPLPQLVSAVVESCRRVSATAAAVSLELCAMMLLAGATYRESDDWPSASALVLFPMVLRSSGLLAALFGVWVVRGDDTETPTAALARGMFVTVILCLVASLGAAKWLIGDRWLVFGACVLFGSVAALACGGGALYYTDRRFRSVRLIAEAARRGGASTVIRGMAVALEGSCVLVLVVAVCGAGAYQLGASTGLSHGGLLGLLLALLGMTCSAPYVFAMDGMGAILDVSGVLSEATLGAQRPDVRARARLLHAVGTSAHAQAAALLTVTVTGAVLLLLASCWAIAAEFGPPTTTALLASGAAAVGAVLGALVILAFVGLLFGRLLGASHVVAMDEATTAAASATPVAEVEVASRTALRGMLAPVGVALLMPICCAVALRIATSGDRVGSSAEALVALIGAATSVGALASLLFTFSGSAWNNAKRHIESGVQGRSDQQATYAAAMVGETIGDAAKHAVGPSLQAAVMTMAALATATLPFFL